MFLITKILGDIHGRKNHAIVATFDVSVILPSLGDGDHTFIYFLKPKGTFSFCRSLMFCCRLHRASFEDSSSFC